MECVECGKSVKNVIGTEPLCKNCLDLAVKNNSSILDKLKKSVKTVKE